MLALALLTATLLTPADVPSSLLGVRCRTPEMWASGLPAHTLTSPGPILKSGTKTQRTPFGALPQVLTSPNFSLQWGDAGQVTAVNAEAIVAALEHSWQRQVVEMGFPQPVGSGSTLFNVYVADTGNGAPGDEGAAGYVTIDAEGYPYMVLAQEVVADPAYGVAVVAHELFHAVQHATGNYPYYGSSAWYLEATAEWVVDEIYPDHASWGSFLFGYALLPHLSVSHFEYPTTGATVEYHQYGAFILPRFLTEHASTPQLIRQSWLHNDAVQDPLVVLAGLLTSSGLDLGDAFGDFAARNTVWDYEHGEHYRSLIEYFRPQVPGDDHEVVATVSAAGTDGWAAAAAATLPRRVAYNTISLGALNNDWVIGVQGAQLSTSGNAAADWRATVVVRDNNQIDYYPVPLVGGRGEIEVDFNGADEAWLSVASVAVGALHDDAFAYEYRVLSPGDAAASPIEPAPEVVPPEASPPAWNCYPTWYGDGECDCGCGTLDIDCADASYASCQWNACPQGLDIDVDDPTACIEPGAPPEEIEDETPPEETPPDETPPDETPPDETPPEEIAEPDQAPDEEIAKPDHTPDDDWSPARGDAPSRAGAVESGCRCTLAHDPPVLLGSWLVAGILLVVGRRRGASKSAARGSSPPRARGRS